MSKEKTELGWEISLRIVEGISVVFREASQKRNMRTLRCIGIAFGSREGSSVSREVDLRCLFRDC